MKRIRTLFVAVAVATSLACATAARADEGNANIVQAPPYKLEEVQYIDKFHGSDEARELLLKQGFVVTGRQYRQIFQAYVTMESADWMPKFITVDSVLHAYHVLLEDGVCRVESEQARLLRQFSQRLYALAAARDDQTEGVYRDLAAFAAVAIGLQDPAEFERLADAHRTAAQPVLDAIGQGSGVHEGVLFFGLPLMADRFQPVSFYAKKPDLSRYFAARQWYATQAFRLESDSETLRAIHLASLVDSDPELKRLYGQLTKPSDVLVGPADDPGLTEYGQILKKISARDSDAEDVSGMLVAFRREATRLPAAKVNDQWLAPEDYRAREERTRGMRVLGARMLPCAALFQKTTDPTIPGRMFPSGVDFFATGPLACDAGRRALRKSVSDGAMADAVLQTDCDPLPDSLYGRAMQLLAHLQRPLPAAVPAALRTPAWHDKQLSTALAAWAEHRHTWALQAKLTLSMGCATEAFPGYVSPYPELYRGLGTLARQTATALDEACSGSLDLAAVGREWFAVNRKVDEMDEARNITMEYIRLQDHLVHAYETCLEEWGKDSLSATGLERTKAAEALDAAARRCIEGKGVTEADRRCMTAFADGPEGGAKKLLPEFADLCDHLAVIAQKELDGEPLDTEERYLVDDYGARLAKFHFYDGNSYFCPRDDFPVTSPVFVSPEGNQAATLNAAVARPEAIYVIVTNGEQAALHLGAVLAYREFQRPIDEPMDDDLWIKEIVTGNVPPAPAWTSSFRRAISEQEVVARIRAGNLDPNVAMMPSHEITLAMIEMLPQIDPDELSSWCQRIGYRATDEDVSSLLSIMTEVQPDQVRYVADCLLEKECCDWRQHGDKLTSLLSHESLPVADSAALLMGRHSETVDVAALAEAYAQQSLRTRRLYLYIIGHHPEPGAVGERLFLDALADPHAAIRYQAAIAISTCKAGSPEIVTRLLSGIDDPNEYTAAAMVRALVALGAKEAAPKMVERLKGDWFATDDDSSKGEAQRTELRDGLGVAGSDVARTLTCYEKPNTCFSRSRRYGAVGSLPEELIAGLGKLQYKPAKEELLRFVYLPSSQGRWHGLGPEAIEALLNMEPERQGQLLVEIVLHGEIAEGVLKQGVTRDILWKLGTKQRRELLLAITRYKKAEPEKLKSLLVVIASGEDPLCTDVFLRLTDLANPSDLDWAITELLDNIDMTARAWYEHLQDIRNWFLQQLRGPDFERAMRVLFQIDRDTAVRGAVEIALDNKASSEIRWAALEQLRKVGDAASIEKLLPLLQEESPSRYADWRLCEEAARTIAKMCVVLDPTVPENAKATELARSGIRKMLTGDYGETAVESLFTMEGKTSRDADLFVQIASDRSFSYAARARAVEVVTRFKDRAAAKRLVPLLDDKTQPQEGGLSIGDHAANAIADLLSKRGWVTDRTSATDREAFRQKARAWTEAE